MIRDARCRRVSCLIVGLLVPLVVMMLLGPVPAAAQPAAKIDFGEPGPQWLRESESYAIGYDPAGWDALAQSKVKFITHCPINREFFARCHALGIRCFPYVTFYQGYASSQSCQGVNLKDHPEFIEVDAWGNLTRSGFWESEDAKNMYTTCPNVVLFGDAMAEPAWSLAVEACRRCDLLIQVGCSGAVWPAAMLPEMAKSSGAPVIAVDPNESPADLWLQGTAGEVLPGLLQAASGGREHD